MNPQKINIQVELGPGQSIVKILHPGQDMDQAILAAVLLDSGLKLLKKVIKFEDESPLEDGPIP